MLGVIIGLVICEKLVAQTITSDYSILIDEDGNEIYSSYPIKMTPGDLLYPQFNQELAEPKLTETIIIIKHKKVFTKWYRDGFVTPMMAALTAVVVLYLIDEYYDNKRHEKLLDLWKEHDRKIYGY